MNYVGLLMIAHEDDVLEDTLIANAPFVDAFYVLDGTEPNGYSRSRCEARVKCCGYWTDAELPEHYGAQPRDGWRQWLYEAAVADWGWDNMFLLLHGDEVWTVDPRRVVSEHRAADGFIFPLPVYFPRSEWDDSRSAIEQLTWHLGPGWPEFRMFRGSERVSYDVGQHFNVRPAGIDFTVSVPYSIRHYAYRSPEVQRERAARHERTGFDPDNYRHITEGDRVIWTDDMIGEWQRQRYWKELREG